MVRSHLERLLHNKLSRYMFLFVLLLPLVDFAQLLREKLRFGVELHPASAFFLSGSTIGHTAQILLLWFLPFYSLLIGAEDAIQDKKTGYRNLLISKAGRKNYVLEKLMTSFVVSFAVLFTALFVNFALCFLFFANGTSMHGLEEIKMPDRSLFSLSIAHPYLTVLLFSLAASLLAGCAGMLGASVSLFFADRKFAYTAAFFIWFLLVLRDPSLMLVFQPFAEYGFDVLVPTFLFSLTVFIVVAVFTFIYEWKFHEN
ncbi:MAG TPA: hypothetical protein VFK44_04805 [Bacillales bacterium]|nr:hypothetical protein [Bacillales bacterium]